MENNITITPFITFLAVWDDDIGPTIIDSYPSRERLEFLNLEEISEQIFQSFQTIFGNSPDIKFERTDLVLPLKSYNKTAKILLDSFPNDSIRGGLQPFFIVLLAPEHFPIKKISAFDKMLTDICRDFKKSDKKHISIKEYSPDFIKDSLKVARKVAGNAKRLLKKNDFEKAFDQYQKAIEMVKTLKAENIESNFITELQDAHRRLIKFTFNQGSKLFSKKKYEDSIVKYKEALKLAEKYDDEILKKKITGKLHDTYIHLAALANKKGDSAVKIRDYMLAHKNYSSSVEWAKLANKHKLIKKYEKKLNRTPNIQPFS